MSEVICPFSSSVMEPWLTIPCDYRRPGEIEHYDLYWCDQSAYGVIFPRPSKEQISAFYDIDEYYTHNADINVQHNESENMPFLKRVLRHIAWRFDKGTDLGVGTFQPFVAEGATRCCDVGCGSGSLLSSLREAGFEEIVGVEPDPAARNVATSQGHTVYEGTAEELPKELKLGSYDLVVCSHVLEHTLNPLSAIQNLSELLRPGGSLVVETPNNEAIGLELAGTTWPWLDVPRHLNFFTTHSLRLACKSAGLEVSGVEYCGYCRQFSQHLEDNQRQIADQFIAKDEKANRREYAYLKGWKLLFRTIFTLDQRKYDSVRVWAKRPI